MNHKILLIEDDPTLNESLKKILLDEKYSVVNLFDVKSAKEIIQQTYLDKNNSPFDLAIVDWMLPDGQGIDIIKEIRLFNLTLPIILLTARNDLIDKIVGLESGANDYVTKPFETRELIARVRAQLRFKSAIDQSQAILSDETVKSPPQKQEIVHGRLVYDSFNREFFYNGQAVSLTKMEFEFLKLLIENPKKTFSREHLLDLVWGYDNYPTTRTIDTHVLQLRQKLSDDVIETIRGLGYRLGTCQKVNEN